MPGSVLGAVHTSFLILIATFGGRCFRSQTDQRNKERIPDLEGLKVNQGQERRLLSNERQHIIWKVSVIATFCKTQAQFTYGMSPTNTGDLKVPASH